MRETLAEIFSLAAGAIPKSGQLGYKLRSFAGRNLDGKAFKSDPGTGGVAKWRVVGAASAAIASGDRGDSCDNPANLYAENGSQTDSRVWGVAETSQLSPSSQLETYEEGDI